MKNNYPQVPRSRVYFGIYDILMESPNESPIKLIIESFDLPPFHKPEITKFLYGTDIQKIEEIEDYLYNEYRIKPDDSGPTLEKIWNNQEQNPSIIPGAKEILKSCMDYGIPLGIISNICPPYYYSFEKLFPEIVERFPIILSYKAGMVKPDVNLYKYALNIGEIKPQNAVMVGDNYKNDMVPAIALGMRTVWILKDREKRQEDLGKVLFEETQSPDIILDNITDLKPSVLLELLAIS